MNLSTCVFVDKVFDDSPKHLNIQSTIETGANQAHVEAHSSRSQCSGKVCCRENGWAVDDEHLVHLLRIVVVAILKADFKWPHMSYSCTSIIDCSTFRP